jgi:3-oxoacyl-[acyl-carrier protein] reductase
MDLGPEVQTEGPGPLQTSVLGLKSPEQVKIEGPISPSCRSAAPAQSTRFAPTAVLLASDEGSPYLGSSLNPNGGDVMI